MNVICGVKRQNPRRYVLLAQSDEHGREMGINLISSCYVEYVVWKDKTAEFKKIDVRGIEVSLATSSKD